MSEWRAAITEEPFGFQFEIRLARRTGRRTDVAISADSGAVTFQETPEGHEIPPLLRLPPAALEALRDALNLHAPPSSDVDLREALSVERGRVDHVVQTLLDRGTS